MPCNMMDGYVSGTDHDARGEAKAAQREAAMVSAIACAILSYLDRKQPGSANIILSNTDWAEAGVTLEQAQAWWDRHIRRDQARRAGQPSP